MIEQAELSSLPSVGELRAAIQDELSALREIDANYAKMRDNLIEWTGSEVARRHLLQKIEERQRRDRAPHVLRLAELHDRMTSSAMSRLMKIGFVV